MVEPFRNASSQGDQGVEWSVPIHLFQVVQPQRTSSNLFEPLQCRGSKVCIGISHEFGVVRLYRTFSNHIFTRGQGVGYLYISSGWFNLNELPRTFSNHFNAEKTMCVEVIELYRTFSNHIFTRGSMCVGYLYTSSGWLNFSNHIFTRGSRYIGYLYTSLGWLNCCKLPRTFSNHLREE